MTTHAYATTLAWEGNTAVGYRAYSREHVVRFGDVGSDSARFDSAVNGSAGRLVLSADAAFLGDAALPNPEQLLLAAASSCQLLSFLAVAARAGVEVTSYRDSASAEMPEDGPATRFTRIDLSIAVVARGCSEERVRELLEQAHQQCYIANTLNAPVHVTAEATIAE
ncbi:OsmC family protein [Serinibacter salmoneus]|nr:OsmC family protein [Serinibacter salmoneus]